MLSHVRGLGYTPDTPDARDYLWSSPLRGRHVEASLVPHVIDVLDQETLNSCVANAGFQAIRMKQHRQGQVSPVLGSRMFAWWCCRAAEHTSKFNTGTRLRTFFDTVNTYGFPPEDVWPYVTRDDGDLKAPLRRRPPTAAFHRAFDMRAPTLYERIPAGAGAPERIRQAISEGNPVCFGADVAEDFVNGRLDPEEPLPAPSRQIVGGHAMVFAGYDPERFLVLNSWGTGWGRGGYCHFGKSYVEAARDIWVVRRAPTPGER